MIAWLDRLLVIRCGLCGERLGILCGETVAVHRMVVHCLIAHSARVRP